MWLWLALGSAFFAGVTAILSKIGVQRIPSHLATALRTAVVLAAAWALVLGTGRGALVAAVSPRTLLTLALSGFATGASWLCYFRALQLGEVSRVAAIDKSSTVLTILLAALLLGEPVSARLLGGVLLLSLGTLLLLGKIDRTAPAGGHGWLFFAVLSAVFAALTAILGKVGVTGLDSNAATAVRTVFVLLCAWLIAFSCGQVSQIRTIDRKSWCFLVLSGLSTGLSWLCYYRALQLGNVTAVVPIDKLSIVVTVVFSRVFLREKPGARGWLGLALLVAGTLLLL